MDATPHFGWPFPEGSDSPDGPAQLGALAQAIEDDTAIRSFGSQWVEAEQSTNSASYTLLGTPDRVQNIVLPTDGLIFVRYRALAKNTLANGQAAIFLDEAGAGDAARLKIPGSGGANPFQEASIADDESQWLLTGAVGLFCPPGAGPVADDVTTGFAVGVACEVEAPAGIYEVSVRFKAASGSTLASRRRLRVSSQAFA